MESKDTRGNDVPVLIAGAGPTGLTLALDLARRGVRSRIIEKATEFPKGSRGRGMQPRTQEVLDDLGLIDAVHAQGSLYPTMRAYENGAVVWEEQVIERLAATSDVPYPNPWMIPQWRTTELLRGRLASFGVEVDLGTELASFEQNSDGVIATLVSNGKTERLRAAYLVGADGGHSSVRQQLGIVLEGVTSDDFRMLVADVRVTGVDRDHWHIWRNPENPTAIVGLCPLGGTEYFQFNAAVVAGAAPQISNAEELTRYFVEHTGRADVRFDDMTWLTTWRPNRRLATQFRIGRVFLAGDAAHVHPPTGGQGLNTGIQDAYNLGWKLGAVLAGAPEALLDTYEQERLPVAASVLGLSARMLTQAIDQKGEPGMLRRGGETRQLGIHYRDSRLSCDDREHPGTLSAGDRAPDGPFGPGVRLFDLFRGPHATLLGFGVSPGGALADVAQRFGNAVHTHAVGTEKEHAVIYRTYDVAEGTFVFIRPDGYIGLMTQSEAKMLDYLAGELFGS